MWKCTEAGPETWDRAQVAWFGGDARQGTGGWRRGRAVLRARDGEALLGDSGGSEQRELGV